MLDPIQLLLRVEVPLEIWIVLVICTGGISIFFMVVQPTQKEPPPPQLRRHPAPESAIRPAVRGIVAAVLNENEDEALAKVWSQFDLPENLRTALVVATKVSLAELMDAETIDANSVTAIVNKLVEKGLPEPLAAPIVQAVIEAIVAAMAQQSGTAEAT